MDQTQDLSTEQPILVRDRGFNKITVRSKGFKLQL